MKKLNFLRATTIFILVLVCFSACEKKVSNDLEQSQKNNTNLQEQQSYSLTPKSIEEICNDFFSDSESDKEMAKILVNRTNEFFAINGGQQEFLGKQTCHIEPIYAYGIEGVAYYEVWLTDDGKTPEGWMLLSATDMDYPLVNFSHNGTPYSLKVKQNATENNVVLSKNEKIYRFGVSFFSMENENSELIAEHGAMPSVILKDVDFSVGGEFDSESDLSSIKSTESIEFIEGVHYIEVDSYETLKREFAENYFTESRKLAAMEMDENVLPKEGSGISTKSTDDTWIYRWVSGTRCYYLQIPANYYWNTTSCYSGCNNNAWANVFGWWDKNKAKASLIPTTSTGETCPTYNNTYARRASVDPVQMYCRSVCNTYCNNGGGWTKWSDAYKGYKYPDSKGYGWSCSYRWCNSKGCHVDLANILTDCIANNYRPAHVGANSHFYMGYGWAQWDTDTQRTWVYCYPGWNTNDSDNLWIHWKDLNSSVKLFIN
jgi:hypothetical protein